MTAYVTSVATQLPSLVRQKVWISIIGDAYGLNATVVLHRKSDGAKYTFPVEHALMSNSPPMLSEHQIATICAVI